MTHKPGHLQFDESAGGKAAPRTPRAIELGGSTAAVQSPGAREPSALFGEGAADLSPALAHAHATFPELARTHAHHIELKLRQLIPWRHDVIVDWAGQALDQNAVITTQTAQLVNRYVEQRIPELVANATAVARSGESGPMRRFFLRGKLLSFKPALTVAKSKLSLLDKECSDHLAALEPLSVRLKINLVALSTAYDVLAKPADEAMHATIASRRMLLQQAIHQAELTMLQLQELRQQLAAQLHSVEQLLTITIPAFEMADAAK